MMDLAPSPTSPPPARRSLLVAVEGADGTGKTSLCAALHAALAKNTYLIKRPRPDGLAHRLLLDALAHGQHAMHDGRLRAAMDDDATRAIRQARALNSDPGTVTLLDRHWLSAVVENYPDPEAALLSQRAAHGEPDLWIICTADWRTVQARLAARGGPDARQTVEGIAGRLARYEWLSTRLSSQVMVVAHDRVIWPGRDPVYMTEQDVRIPYIAYYIRYLQGQP